MFALKKYIRRNMHPKNKSTHLDVQLYCEWRSTSPKTNKLYHMSKASSAGKDIFICTQCKLRCQPFGFKHDEELNCASVYVRWSKGAGLRAIYSKRWKRMLLHDNDNAEMKMHRGKFEQWNEGAANIIGKCRCESERVEQL